MRRKKSSEKSNSVFWCTGGDRKSILEASSCWGRDVERWKILVRRQNMVLD